MDLATVGTDVEKVIATEEQLAAKIAELAARVDADYKDKKVLLVGVLKGAIMAMADLTARCRLTLKWIGWQFLPTAQEQNQVV